VNNMCTEQYVGIDIKNIEHKLNQAAGHSHFDEKTLPIIKDELANVGWNVCTVINEKFGGLTYYWLKDNKWYRLQGDMSTDKVWLERIYFTPGN